MSLLLLLHLGCGTRSHEAVGSRACIGGHGRLRRRCCYCYMLTLWRQHAATPPIGAPRTR
jgi:hypothetical protein